MLGIAPLQYLTTCKPKQSQDTRKQWVCAVRHGFCTERCRDAFCYKRIFSVVNISVLCIPLLTITGLCFLFFSNSNSDGLDDLFPHLGSTVVPLHSSHPPEYVVNGKTVLRL